MKKGDYRSVWAGIGEAPTEKLCRKCGTTKPIEEFRPTLTYHHGEPYGYRRPNHQCSSCEKEYARRYAQRTSARKAELTRRATLARNFGITLEQYDALKIAQADGCAICGKKLIGKRAHLDVDHDHSTGRVRGLLCHSCNVGLGLMGDDPARLRQAAAYVTSASAQPPSAPALRSDGGC